MKMNIGRWAFLLGFGGAILVGLMEGLHWMPTWSWVGWALVVLGLVIGIMNVSSKERVPVIIAAGGLAIGAGVVAGIPMIGGVLESILNRIVFIALPIAIVPAVYLLWDKTKK